MSPISYYRQPHQKQQHLLLSLAKQCILMETKVKLERLK